MKYGNSIYRIVVANPNNSGRGIGVATLDGKLVKVRPLAVPFVDDGRNHLVNIALK